MQKKTSLQVATEPAGSWVQTERAAHERWAKLAIAHPRASALLHVLLARMGRHNALVASQKVLAKMADCNPRTVQRSLEILSRNNWIEVRQIGDSGTVNAYIVNARVAWSGKRDGIRYALFEAAVLVADADQPDRDDIGMLAPLETIPALYPGEAQMPTGAGMPPPSEPALPGFEPDLPARALRDE